MNIPIIAFCNSDSHLKNVDFAIPFNTHGKEAIGTCWWLLCGQLLKFRGKLPAQAEWEVMPDLFFYRDLEEVEEQEQEAVAKPAVADEWAQATKVQPAAVGTTGSAGFGNDAFAAFAEGDVPEVG